MAHITHGMRIAYDIDLMRPGCAIVQAALGGDPEACVPFATRDWQLTPTPAMRVYEVTLEQLAVLVKKTEAAR